MEVQSARTSSTAIEDTQPHKLDVREYEYGITHQFLCEEDKELWASLHHEQAKIGERKELESLHKKLREKYGSMPKFEHLWKLLSRFLVGPNNRNIMDGFLSVSGFIAVTRWFGSFKSIPNGDSCYCLQQIENLMKKGGIKRGRSFISWFAGFMTSDEAQTVLAKQQCETYLVRFSESLQSEGGFALAIKGKEENEVYHYHFKGDPSQACKERLYKARLKLQSESKEISALGPYNNVVQLVDDLKINEIDGLNLNIICPELPLNAVFQGYR